MFALQMMNEIDNFQHEIEQLFRGLGCNERFDVRTQGLQLKTEDRGEAVQVEAVLPGLDVEKLDISVLGRRMTLSGEFAEVETPEDAVRHRRERYVGTFQQSLQLPTEVDTDKVSAEYKNGILSINLPKAASALPKKISIKTA